MISRVERYIQQNKFSPAEHESQDLQSLGLMRDLIMRIASGPYMSTSSWHVVENMGK